VTSSPTRCRTCIIGGGAIGSFLAYWLATLSRGSDVTVVEPDLNWRRSSTPRSAAAIRVQYNLSQNVELSLASAAFFARAHELLKVDDEPASIGFEAVPYLVLAGHGGVERLRGAHERRVSAGADVVLLDSAAALYSAAPWLKTEGIGAATLGRTAEGWVDPRALLVTLRRKLQSLGVQYVPGRVHRLNRTAERIASVEVSNNTTIVAEHVVICAGAWSAAIAAMVGVTLPIEPRKRSAFVFQSAAPPAAFLNVVDPTFGHRGVYVRPFGLDFMAVTSPAPATDRPSRNLTPDLGLFDEVIRPALARRVRGFEHIVLKNAWAGAYEINTFDQNAVIGAHPILRNLFFSCGYSGHGVMHAPAAGRGLAELLLYGAYKSIDLSVFGLQRITENTPLDDVQASEHRTLNAGI
jgi:FAD-dependent oxidoreductase domain-containing protein 1